MANKIIDLVKIPITEQQSSFLNLLKDLRINLDTGPYVAGGAARRFLYKEPIGSKEVLLYPSNGDIDVFFANDHQLHDCCNILIDKLEHELLEVTDNAVTYGIKHENIHYHLQMIYKYYGPTISSILNQFDFTICKLAICPDYILATPQALEDLKTKTLRFASDDLTRFENVPERIAKYISYGFTPVTGTVSSIFEKIQPTGYRYRHY